MKPTTPNVPGFTAVPNEIIAHLPQFTGPELAFLLLMFRRETALQSLRFHEQSQEAPATTKISDADWKTTTGYSLRTKAKAIHRLKIMMLVTSGEHDNTLYGLDWHAWRRFKNSEEPKS